MSYTSLELQNDIQFKWNCAILSFFTANGKLSIHSRIRRLLVCIKLGFNVLRTKACFNAYQDMLSLRSHLSDQPAELITKTSKSKLQLANE